MSNETEQTQPKVNVKEAELIGTITINVYPFYHTLDINSPVNKMTHRDVISILDMVKLEFMEHIKKVIENEQPK